VILTLIHWLGPPLFLWRCSKTTLAISGEGLPGNFKSGFVSIGLELSLYIPASSDGNVGLYGGFTYEVTEEVKGAGAVIMVQDKDTKPNLLDGKYFSTSVHTPHY